MMHKPSLLAGVAVAVAARAALPYLVRAKLDRDLQRLNAGDYQPMLAGFADDAVLRFYQGPHRWSGPHVGKDNIERFLANFVGAGLRGELGRLWISGPPWAFEFCVRFDDTAYAPDGELIYANHNVIWVRTRWGKIVEQRDFFEDTSRILDLDAELDAQGVPPVT